MAGSRGLYLVLVVALLGQAFCVPADVLRYRRGYVDNELDTDSGGKGVDDLAPEGSNNKPIVRDGTSIDVGSKEEDSAKSETTTNRVEYASPVFEDSDSDEDDDFEPMNTAPSAGGGSNIFSLLRLANALFPSSSSGGNARTRNLIRSFLYNPFYPINYNPRLLIRRQDIIDNIIEVDNIKGLKPPPLQKQEIEESGDISQSSNLSENESDEGNNAAEESNELGNGNGENGNGSKPKSESQESNGKGSNENDSDYSEEPEGDGQGGGILGILAGLSGGEDGQSDLGSLLATISGIVANLSGDGFDLNALIGSGIGLFVGLLSEGEENPGAVIASYLLTSLDTITGGGSQNNGAFFGNLLSKLIRGTSAQRSEPRSDPQWAPSALALLALGLSLLLSPPKSTIGPSACYAHQLPSDEQAKTPGEQPASPIWTLKMDILRALLQFGTSILGMASSSSSGASGGSA